MDRPKEKSRATQLRGSHMENWMVLQELGIHSSWLNPG